jgi:hypothetical protein
MTMDKLTLINPNIHQEAKLKKDKFLERIKNVQNLRTCYLERNFLPGEEMEWEILEELHKAINTGVFSFGVTYKVFTFEIDKELYDWFKYNDLQTIQKQVVNWVAAVYLSQPLLQEYLDDYIYSPILSEAKRVIKNHYSKAYSDKYKVLDETVEFFDSGLNGENDKEKYKIYETFQEENSDEIDKPYGLRGNEYRNASLRYINCLPPKFLQDPTAKSDVVLFDNYGLRYSPLLKIRIGYFTDIDWLYIVERDLQKAIERYKPEIERRIKSTKDVERIMEHAKTDALNRSESDKEIFSNWLFSYRNYEKTKNHIFQLFLDETPVGLIYVIRQRNSNNFKIGWTEQKKGMNEKQSVKNRVAGLQTGNPEPLDIVGFFRASGTKTERALHSLFDSKRRTGEWFLLDQTDWQNILSDDWRISKNIF